MGLVKGIALLNIRSFVTDQFGPKAWDSFFAKLPSADRTALSDLAPSSWYDLSLLSRVRRALDVQFGQGDLSLVEALGRFEAEKDLSTVMRWFFRVIPPDFAVRQMDLYWRRFHDSGHWTSEVQNRDIIARLNDWAVVDEALCRNLIGYLQRMLELIPNRDLHVDHPRCRVHGHPSCEFIWRWQPASAARDPKPLTSRDITEIGREVVQITDPDTLGHAIAEVLVHQFGCRKIALWKLPKSGGEAKLLHATPDRGAGAKRCFVLEIRGRAVGRLEVETGSAKTGSALPDLFEDLLPWFAMALDGTHDPSEEFAGRIARAADQWGLTPRQREVLHQLARGRCNKDIAARLDLQGGTVELHVSQILKKAGAESRATLIAELWACP
jgi:DNA-binding CsgD family transcriptional regulator